MEEKRLIDPIEFEKYDKISDSIYAIGFNCSLRFNVILSKGYNGKRYPFHKEFEYQSKYTDGPPMIVTMKRDYDYYLSIENNSKPERTAKAFIRIGPAEFYLLKNGVDTAVSWFRDKRYEKLYQMDGNKLIITRPIPDYTVGNLPMGKYIKFTPGVQQKGTSEYDVEPVVSMELSDSLNIVQMSVDKLMGLEYTLSNFNMVLCAQSMLAYLPMPDYGVNRVVMNNGMYSDETVAEGVTGVDGRQIPGLINRKNGGN